MVEAPRRTQAQSLEETAMRLWTTAEVHPLTAQKGPGTPAVWVAGPSRPLPRGWYGDEGPRESHRPGPVEVAESRPLEGQG